MGGPWRAQGFDPMAWRAPRAQVQAHPDSAARGGRDYVVVIVLGYLASVVTSVIIMLTLMKGGW